MNLRNNPYSYVRGSFGSWASVELMWRLPDALLELPALEQLDIQQTFISTFPDRPFASDHLEPVVLKDTLLTRLPAAHQKLALDVASAHERAVFYIKHWFSPDMIDTYALDDPKHAPAQSAAASAILQLLLQILETAEAPRDPVVEMFEKQSAWLAKRIENPPRRRTFFQTMRDTVETWERAHEATAWTAAIKATLAKHA